MDVKSLSEFIPFSHKPFLVAGPCSAETEEQVYQTASQLADIQNVKILRSGIWKPRTRPNSFEGMGEKALPWLVKAAKDHGFLSATEVANSHHVELCLKAGVDILWIGARTTVNPFTVQEIADALQGVDKPVFIKNPVNPDIELWVGAIERIYNTGNRKIVAVHRGFSTAEKYEYRNAPMWEIPIELKRRFPKLPLICDPSHIAGKRSLLQKVSQKALDLDVDGLMIETHIDPDKALSDAQQQITPLQLTQLLSKLVYKQQDGLTPHEHAGLEKLRLEIDELDEKIIALLADRMRISQKIGVYKKAHQMTTLQLERWRHIFESRTKQGTNLGLTERFLQKFLENLHKESIKRQEGE
ncbi:MAG TPA: chorismate mutase [Flavobacteriales bacterium]|nr:chorismate mutase [Flavobacteriales bacterium]